MTGRQALRTLYVLGCLICLVLAGASGGRPASAQEAEGQRYTPASRSPREAVQELAAAHFAPAWVAWAVRTARCESGFDLYAYSAGFDRRFGWYQHVGPWQVSVPVWGATAWALFGGSLWDPDVGAAMAAWIVKHHGPSHWPVCGR